VGYGAHVGNRRTRVIGAGGAIHGYSLNLDRIDIMGASLIARADAGNPKSLKCQYGT